jgi:hypothetical protein
MGLLKVLWACLKERKRFKTISVYICSKDVEWLKDLDVDVLQEAAEQAIIDCINGYTVADVSYIV